MTYKKGDYVFKNGTNLVGKVESIYRSRLIQVKVGDKKYQMWAVDNVSPARIKDSKIARKLYKDQIKDIKDGYIYLTGGKDGV